MPSKLFQKRKEDAAERARRSAASRSQHKRYLIVCEGSKTEPNYFYEFLKNLGRSSIKVSIPRDHNTSPSKLLSQAKILIRKDNDFDYAFLVTDRDEFEDFEAAKHAADQIKSSPKIQFIYSDPCFEVWLIFHYQPIDKPISRMEALEIIKGHIPDYDKGKEGIGDLLFPFTDKAVSNSKAVFNRCKETGTTCPSSLVHMIIENFLEPNADQ